MHFLICAFLINSFLLFLLLENLIYNKFFNLQSSNFRIIIFTIIPLVISMHITHRVQAIDKSYFYSTNSPKTNSGGLWQFDSLLGHKAVPDSTGSYEYYIGDGIKGRVPVTFDSSGYRSVPDSLELRYDTLDLYLGCSLTFGDYIEAQNGYPYLTSKLLEHSHINAGASAYGFGQMIQIVESLVKKHQFKYVFIQLSPWLSDRAMRLTGPTFYGYRPFPYFSDDGIGFKLNPPAFSTLMYSKKNWRGKQSYFEKIRFRLTDGSKIEIIDYYSYQYSKLKTILGFIPKPTKRKADLEKFFYDYVIDICKKNNSIPIILKLRYPSAKCSDLLKYLRAKTQIIDLDYDLEKKVDETGLNYQELFSIYHTNGDDSILIDKHPNNFANELFSRRIYNDLKKE